jgi:uncharacterized membrane protein YphA (DoxX/SURF4 family)
MKKIKIIYWTATILFVLFMGSTAIPDILSTTEAVSFMNQLGYPHYFVPFIGVLKLLGCIALLVPGYPRIKELAYAGFAYDLIGAIYSAIAVGGFDVKMLIMLLPIGLMLLSYVYFHKQNKEQGVRVKE